MAAFIFMFRVSVEVLVSKANVFFKKWQHGKSTII